MRRIFGWLVFILLLPVYACAMIGEAISVRLQAVCEATVCSIMDKENWLYTYKREIEFR